MPKNNIISKFDCRLLFPKVKNSVRFDGQIKLIFFGLSSRFQCLDYLVPFLFFLFCVNDLLSQFGQFIIYFKVACWQKLKDRISVVFKEKDIIIGFIVAFGICETLHCEASLKWIFFWFISFEQNSLAIFKMGICLRF